MLIIHPVLVPGLSTGRAVPYNRPISKSEILTPLREYYVWWSGEMLNVYRLDKKKDN